MRHPHLTDPEVINGGGHEAIPDPLLVEAIALTAEVCGLALSSAAAEMLASDLTGFDQSVILAALKRCRMELQGRLRLTDILARIEDGRPSADEAWTAMPKTEHASVVWTEEMAQAWGMASPLLARGDDMGARAAFQEAYVKAVLAARIKRVPVHWMPSLGSDVAGRESVLLDALEKQRLPASHVAQLLPVRTVPSGAREIFAQLKLKKLH
ncbi:MAG: hypothetical protein V4632_07925 [Pseudomonadota bacterium]